MLNLFNQYRQEGKYSEALIVIQNIFNKNVNNTEIFSAYFDVLTSLANDKRNIISERQQFLQQAHTVLSFYSENVDMDRGTIDFIKIQEVKLNNAIIEINKDIDEDRKKQLKTIISTNDNSLESVQKLCNKLHTIKQQSELDEIAVQITEVDAVIESEYLTERQKQNYEVLSKKCSQIIERKMKEIELNKNRTYNLQAIEAYEKIFQFFKASENISYHESILKDFFKFDASKLYNETLIYYNHVYSFILSKLNDDQKFLLTKLAILSEKK